MADYGLKRSDYIESFMNAVDWNVALDRFVASSGRTAAGEMSGKSAVAKSMTTKTAKMALAS